MHGNPSRLARTFSTTAGDESNSSNESEGVRHNILASSLSFVSDYGWTTQTLAKVRQLVFAMALCALIIFDFCLSS